MSRRRLAWLALWLGLGYAVGHRHGADDARAAMLAQLGRALIGERRP